MKVALDMDEVIVDFVGGLLGAINAECGSDLRYENVTRWDMSPLLDPVLGRSWWGWLAERADIWSGFAPVDGALEGIDALKAAGHTIEVVTAKPDWARHTVWGFLAAHRPRVDAVVIVDGTPKHDASDAWLLIDDNADNCTGWAASGRPAWIKTSPWNINEALPDGVMRVTGWADICGRLCA